MAIKGQSDELPGRVPEPEPRAGPVRESHLKVAQAEASRFLIGWHGVRGHRQRLVVPASILPGEYTTAPSGCHGLLPAPRAIFLWPGAATFQICARPQTQAGRFCGPAP